MRAVSALQLFTVRSIRICIAAGQRGASVGCWGRSRTEPSLFRGIAALLCGADEARGVVCTLQMLSSRDQCYDLRHSLLQGSKLALPTRMGRSRRPEASSVTVPCGCQRMISCTRFKTQLMTLLDGRPPRVARLMLHHSLTMQVHGKPGGTQ